jgi:hypothetical protein
MSDTGPAKIDHGGESLGTGGHVPALPNPTGGHAATGQRVGMKTTSGKQVASLVLQKPISQAPDPRQDNITGRN